MSFLVELAGKSLALALAGDREGSFAISVQYWQCVFKLKVGKEIERKFHLNSILSLTTIICYQLQKSNDISKRLVA